MNLGWKLVAIAGLLVTPIFAVDQDYHREFRNDTRYELRRSMERMRADLRREFAHIRENTWRTRLEMQREIRHETRQARMDALRTRLRAREEARREIREMRRYDRRWF